MTEQSTKRPTYLDEPGDTRSPKIGNNPPPKSRIEPMLLAGGAFFAGFIAASGRWELMTRTGRNLARHLGVLISDYASFAFQETRNQMRRKISET